MFPLPPREIPEFLKLPRIPGEPIVVEVSPQNLLDRASLLLHGLMSWAACSQVDARTRDLLDADRERAPAEESVGSLRAAKTGRISFSVSSLGGSGAGALRPVELMGHSLTDLFSVQPQSDCTGNKKPVRRLNFPNLGGSMHAISTACRILLSAILFSGVPGSLMAAPVDSRITAVTVYSARCQLAPSRGPAPC